MLMVWDGTQETIRLIEAAGWIIVEFYGQLIQVKSK